MPTSLPVSHPLPSFSVRSGKKERVKNMAVEAQQLLSELAFVPDLRFAGVNHDDQHQQLRTLLGPQSNLGYPPVLSGTVFSTGQQNSELTCNGTSGSRKRGRDEYSSIQPLPAQQHYTTLLKQNLHTNQIATTTADHFYGGGDSRRVDSSAVTTSTSGRSSCTSTDAPGGDLISCLYHQNLELDALVRLQSERLRSGLEEASKRHCRALLSLAERQIQRRLAEKESELERARRRNVELEEKMKQAIAENQVWFGVARNNEAVVASLRSSLEQALLLQQNAANNTSAGEGFGDSGGNDEESCCFDDEQRSRMERGGVESPAGKGYGGKEGGEVCVLLLPCRHLCLCKSCESKVDTCPICNTPRKASIQVFMS